MEDKYIRARFIEEITDVQNYYIEVLNRLQITPEEYSKAYIEKHNSNMKRNYEKENKEIEDLEERKITNEEINQKMMMLVEEVGKLAKEINKLNSKK